jgi:hypothetical protein
MAEHEPCIGLSSDWFTPPEIFEALDLTFDLDPCSPGPSHWVPARKIYTVEDDGLAQPWEGLTFVNPPFGGRHCDRARLHIFGMVQPIRRASGAHALSSRQDQIHPTRWLDRPRSGAWDRAPGNGRGGLQRAP